MSNPVAVQVTVAPVVVIPKHPNGLNLNDESDVLYKLTDHDLRTQSAPLLLPIQDRITFENDGDPAAIVGVPVGAVPATRSCNVFVVASTLTAPGSTHCADTFTA